MIRTRSRRCPTARGARRRASAACRSCARRWSGRAAPRATPCRRRPTRCCSAARCARRARAGTCRCRCVAFGSYGPSVWFLSQAPWNTTNCMSGNWRETATMSSGRLCAASKLHERQTLVRDEDLHAEIVRLLDHRQADRGVVEREPLTVRSPRGVHLERRDLAGVRRRLPSRRAGALRSPKFGRDHVVHEHARRAAVRELRRELLGAELVGETEPARRPGPEFGTSESIATVVSLARNRSWRYAARLAHSSWFDGAARRAPCRARAARCRVRSWSTGRRASRDACARRRRTRRCRRARARTPRPRASAAR